MQDIKEILQKHGFTPGINSESVKQAQDMLAADEIITFAGIYDIYIVAATPGPLDPQVLDLKGKNTGVIGITNKRVFISINSIDVKKTKSLALSELQSPDDSDTSNRLRIKGMAEEFVIESKYNNLDELKQIVADLASNPPAATPETATNTATNLDEIQKLKELLDSGAITQSEYDLKKKDLLGLNNAAPTPPPAPRPTTQQRIPEPMRGPAPNSGYQSYSQPYRDNTSEQRGGSGMAVASMVLGIVSLVLLCIIIGGPIGLIGLILGIVVLAKNKPGKGYAIAGVVMCAISVIVFIFMLIGFVSYDSYGNFYLTIMQIL